MKITTTTRVVDIGLTDALKASNALDGSYTKVGFPSEGKAATGEADSMIDIATNAAILNFGVTSKSGIKRWPFLASALTKNKKRTDELLAWGAQMVYEGKASVKKVLGIIGEDSVNKVKQEMRSISAPQEEPETIKRKKGASNPTIDTGQMLNSVTHIEVIK